MKWNVMAYPGGVSYGSYGYTAGKQAPVANNPVKYGSPLAKFICQEIAKSNARTPAGMKAAVDRALKKLAKITKAKKTKRVKSRKTSRKVSKTRKSSKRKTSRSRKRTGR